MAPDPASTVYTPQPRGEANIAKTTPTAAAKRTRTPPRAASAPAKPQGRQGRPGVIHSSLYLPEALYEALREAAFRERCKIHDIVLEGIRLAG
jgi:hypothetical protein